MNGSGLWAKSFVNFMIGCLNILYVPAWVPKLDHKLHWLSPNSWELNIEWWDMGLSWCEMLVYLKAHGLSDGQPSVGSEKPGTFFMIYDPFSRNLGQSPACHKFTHKMDIWVGKITKMFNFYGWNWINIEPLVIDSCPTANKIRFFCIWKE